MKNQLNKTLEVLTRSFETYRFDERSEAYFTKIAGADMSMHNEFKKYSSVLNLIDFEKLRSAVEFMSSKEVYMHYIGKSAVFKLTSNANGIKEAIRQANAQAREEYLSDYQDLSKDESITLNRCSTSAQKIDYVSESIIAQINDKIKINTALSLMQVETVSKSEEKLIVSIKEYSSDSFTRFLYHCLGGVLSFDEMHKVVKKIEITSELYGKDSTIIQFRDCYIEDCVVKKGFYKGGSLPRFYIDRAVYRAVERGKPTKVIKAVDELLLHLASFDNETFERMVFILSTIFFNNEELKSKFNQSLRFYGKDGRNGKSLFSALMQKAFGKENCQIFSIADLNDQKTLYAVANSLVAIDSDSSGKTISEDSAATFKSLTSGERVQIKGLYQKATTVETSCSIIAFSNVLPNSSDKTSAYLRRLEIVGCNYQILDEDEEVGSNSKRTMIDTPQEWFDSLRSDEAAQYLIELLLIRSQLLLKNRTLPKKSQAMKDLLNRFSKDNDSAAAFVEEVGLENIIGFMISEVRDKYSAWCQEADMPELKRKFNQTLSDLYGIDTLMTSKIDLVNKSSNAFSILSSKAKRQVRVWRYSDEFKTSEFLKEHEESVMKS